MKHTWVPAREVGMERNWTVCKLCGIVKNNKNGDADNCKGHVRITTRITSIDGKGVQA